MNRYPTHTQNFHGVYEIKIDAPEPRRERPNTFWTTRLRLLDKCGDELATITTFGGAPVQITEVEVQKTLTDKADQP